MSTVLIVLATLAGLVLVAALGLWAFGKVVENMWGKK